MKKIYAAAILSSFFFVSAQAADQARINPNGFPSGDHYNLNLHGKKSDFTCPSVTVDEFGNPIYGNSVFMPENGTGIDVVLRSGSAKGKLATTVTELKAVDPCTTAIDGNPALVEIPPNANGYRVYARALAKPTFSPEMNITPSLVSAVDENGEDLVYLGQVTSTGFTTPSATFQRLKGKSTGVEITEMFKWTGDVCYFEQPTDISFTPSNTCCTDTNLDGILDNCQPSVLAGDGVTSVCSDPTYQLVSTYCHSYSGEWVFNIADIVDIAWSLDNSGLKLLQIRFYPVK